MKTVGILGLGSIGKRHADNLLEMGHKVVAYDPYFVGFTKAQGDIHLCQTVEEFYEAKKDAVVIASPTSLHARHISGLHPFKDMAIFVEKPMAESIEEVVGLYRLNPEHVTVGNNLRFHGCVQKAKEWLVGRGTPIWANFTVAQYNGRPRYLRDGVTLNWGAHEMDLALYLLGPAEVVGASINKEDTISQILLMHESGCRTMLHFDYLTMNEVRTFMIQGQDKLIACNIPLGAIGTDDVGTSEDNDFAYVWDKDFNETYVLEMKAFLDGDTSIAATGEDGLWCLKLLLDAKKMGGI